MVASFALLVAAIDFGTTFSGWGFSFRHEFESEPTKVFTKPWPGGQLSLKAPTSILIEPDGLTLHSFGYEAENKYADLVANEEHETWFFFQRFKMKLYEKQRLGRDMVLEDISGKKSLSAKKVFSLSIKYMKDDFMKMLQGRTFGCGIKEDEIHWVLTVPAIWNDAAKQFMREAAQGAGILQDKLSIALEPEAASLFCRHLRVEKISSDKTTLSTFEVGKKYIVLDAGGGTVDITVHEVLSGGKLKELYKASGGNWGGTRVDQAFTDFLSDLAGSDVMTKFKDRHIEDYIDLLRHFEVKKRDICPSSESKVTIKIPQTFSDLVRECWEETLQERIGQSVYSSQVKLVGDKLRIEASIAKLFFVSPISSIINHVKALLQEPVNKGVAAILMVGGFSESHMLQEAIRNDFPNLGVIVPNEAGLAVLKGAVIFGHNPSTMSERVSKYTYGVNTNTLFRPDYHPVHKKKMINNKAYCTDIFSVHVRAGETLVVGQPQTEQSYFTISYYQKKVIKDVYATLQMNPKYIDNPGSHRIGTITVPVSGVGERREVTVKMIFGGTEIDVECHEVATGKITHAIVDFLT
ncbi:heat shock 70 kDa protein 12B-like [Mercenaria mercenaria]|uniref:heat shock 70 kDa protein 12B-like n=1 Tax=Mercenaria mercenaria TaxID=6596 RepID=UPI00234E81FA|nr:heat shock 70 kDa protein 12B-like [Mercenaria mercenaria]